MRVCEDRAKIAHARKQDQRVTRVGAFLRHKAKPGITGWAQVNGFRGEMDTLDKMRAGIAYDLDYLRRWSLPLDLRIIARTLKIFTGRDNAY